MADRTDQSDGQAMTDPTPLLSLRGIGKRYGAVVAVREVDLDIFPGGIWSYGEYHIVNQTIYALGFSPIAATAQVPEGEANITISAELLPDYDADIVVAFPYGRSFDALLAETPTLDTLTSVKQGRFILLGDLAFSAASVVSIPYAVDQLVPQFAAALAP